VYNIAPIVGDCSPYNRGLFLFWIVPILMKFNKVFN